MQKKQQNEEGKKAWEMMGLAFDKLDKKTQEFLTGEKYIKIIKNLEKKHILTNDETFEVQSKTLYAMLKTISKTNAIDDIVLALRNRSAANTEKVITDIKKEILIYA